LRRFEPQLYDWVLTSWRQLSLDFTALCDQTKTYKFFESLDLQDFQKIYSGSQKKER